MAALRTFAADASKTTLERAATSPARVQTAAEAPAGAQPGQQQSPAKSAAARPPPAAEAAPSGEASPAKAAAPSGEASPARAAAGAARHQLPPPAAAAQPPDAGAGYSDFGGPAGGPPLSQPNIRREMPAAEPAASRPAVNPAAPLPATPPRRRHDDGHLTPEVSLHTADGCCTASITLRHHIHVLPMPLTVQQIVLAVVCVELAHFTI